MSKRIYVKPACLCVQAAPATTLLAGSGGQLEIGSGQADTSHPILAPRADWSSSEGDGDDGQEW